MNNRWGRQVEQKGQVRGPGQNYININFNFAGVKDKPNPIQGKKIDNFIEINSDTKPQASRPNVSMETLKQKKKKNVVKEETPVSSALARKKSKSRINDAFTPEKKIQEKGTAESKSMNKKSTKKRNSKSTENLRLFSRRRTPEANSNSKSKSNEKLHSYEKSRSRSKSQSTKKLTKNSSKNKIGLHSRPKTAGNSTAAIKPQQQLNQKAKKIPVKKAIEESEQGAFKKKREAQKFPRKKLSHDESKKNMKSSITQKRRKSKQKEIKLLQRHPLFHGDDDNFDEQNQYKRLNGQAHRLLFEDPIQNQHMKKEIKREKEANRNTKMTLYQKFTKHKIDAIQLEYLNSLVLKIQKNWRGFRDRTKLINEIKMMDYKVQINKKKIAELDERFWDDGKSNSIIKGEEDASSSMVLEDPMLNSDIEKPISESLSNSLKKMSANRIIEYECSQEVLERLNKLEQEMEQERKRNKKLEEQNKDLKSTLQKVSIHQSLQSGINSGLHSMNSSLKSNGQDWEQVKIRPQSQSESEIENNSSSHFELRLPKKIESKIHKNEENNEEKSENSQLNKYKNKMEAFECSSPKFSQTKISIDTALVELFKKKENDLKETYEKKSTMFERMLKDSIFSPRTYNFKKSQLDVTFKRQTDTIKGRLEEATKAIDNFAQGFKEEKLSQERKENKDLKEEKSSYERKQNTDEFIPRQNHVIQDFGHINLNSHRSSVKSSDLSERESSNSEREGDKEIIVSEKEERIEDINEKIIKKIDSNNKKAIKIFEQIEEENKKEEIKEPQAELGSEKEKQEEERQNYIEGNSDEDEEQEQDLPENRPRHRPESQPQDPEQEVAGVDSNENVVVNKGFETTLLFIKEYCVTYFQFLRSSDEHRLVFIEGICSPIQYDMIEFLKAYRTTTDNQNSSTFNSQIKDFIYPYFKYLFPKSQVLTRESFIEFNAQYEKLQTECEFPAEREYFTNSLLDAFNEAFDYERPCSYYGQAPPWISEHRTLKNHPLCLESDEQKEKFGEATRFEEACGSAIARVIQWSTSLCGFIPESPDIGDVVIDEQQINHIRETRMALMLEKDLLENQEQMLDSVIEQTEVKLQVSQVIVNGLIDQFLKEYDFFK